MMRCLALMFLVTMMCACGTAPGKPGPEPEVPSPDQILDFSTLFAQNCSGCHGKDGSGGAAIPLSDPTYLALVDVDTIRKIVAQGVKSTPMPAFAQGAGGTLTDKQIDVIVAGIRSHWSKPGILNQVTPPSYRGTSTGDAARGAGDYKVFCESCHGAEGRGGPKGSSIVDPAFLSLTSDQGLRSIVIVGRPDLGFPDWRGDVPGRAMSDQEVTDIVAWLARQRPNNTANAKPAEGEARNAR